MLAKNAEDPVVDTLSEVQLGQLKADFFYRTGIGPGLISLRNMQDIMCNARLDHAFDSHENDRPWTCYTNDPVRLIGWKLQQG